MKQITDKLIFSDESFIASFDNRDIGNYRREFSLIQNKQIDPNIWFNKLKRIHNDQTVYDDLHKTYFEPINVGISGNKLVNEGLEGMAECMVGGRSKMFDVYGIGEGLVTVNVRDTQLSDEVLKLDIRDNGGFVLNRGSTCFYSLFFPKTVKSTTITESAIFDNLKSPDTMLLRTLFPTSEQQVHVKNLDAIYVGHIVYVGSV